MGHKCTRGHKAWRKGRRKKNHDVKKLSSVGTAQPNHNQQQVAHGTEVIDCQNGNVSCAAKALISIESKPQIKTHSFPTSGRKS